MTSEEILQKVRKIEIKTRGLSKNIFAGEYHSQFKGRGMTFSEVREYQAGDDVRSIDWNVTARLGKPYIKVFEEERELTVMLLIDVSGSSNFGTVSQMKRDMMTEVAATLAFSTIENNDKVGVIFFTDKIEKYIPPKKGKKHVLHIIRELIDFQPELSKQLLQNLLRSGNVRIILGHLIPWHLKQRLYVATFYRSFPTVGGQALETGNLFPDALFYLFLSLQLGKCFLELLHIGESAVFSQFLSDII